MKKLVYASFISAFFFSSMQAVCYDAFLLATYAASTSASYVSQEGDIASEINTLTDKINDKIKEYEDDTLEEYKKVKRLKEGNALSLLKRAFLTKQQNELQGIVNSIKAE